MASHNEAFMKRLLETFAIEAKEHVDQLSEGLLSLDKAADPSEAATLVEALFREAHSLKGASRAVEITEIEELCKAMEEVFGRYKKSREPFPGDLVETMLESTDMLELLSRSDETGRRTLKPQIQNLIERLVQTVPKHRDGIHVESSRPAVTKMQEPQRQAPTHEKKSKHENTVKNRATQERVTPAETIRIGVDKLDAILVQSEELLFAKMVSRRHLNGLNLVLEKLRESAKKLQMSREGEILLGAMEQALRREIKRSGEDGRETAMMVDRLLGAMKEAMTLPFSTLFHTLPKTVHDMAKSVGKEARLEITGGDVEIDRRILEEMHDPLTHLLRNATDHGIETPEVRRMKGKDERGSIELIVRQTSASKVEISIRDDGAGIDTKKLLHAAVKNGVVESAEADAMPMEQLLGLMFYSGVSTSDVVTDLSGRGLGLAIVQEKAERLGGTVKVSNLDTGGSEFTILLPLTMATFRGVLTSVGGGHYIFPSEHVVRVTELTWDGIKNVEGREMAVIDHHVLPFYRFDTILNLPSTPDEASVFPAIVVSLGQEMLVIGVDAIHSEEEVMVKSLGRQLSRVRNIAGAALLASDRPGLIVNVSDLFKSVGMVSTVSLYHESEAPVQKAKVLVADDSMTTRALLQNIMEMAGYDVVTASDGLEAYEALKKEPFSLVVSDVDMPRMNGFELTASIRSEEKLASTPVVLVTSMESPEDRERGMKAGADAYIAKSTFDQNNLMERIRWLIN